MTPEDIAIIKGAPQVRRDFLDLQISQVDPLYIHFLSRYQRAMRQRNALLRVRQTASIEIWEHEMAQAAAYIIHSRCEAVEGLRSLCQEHYNLFGTSAEKLDLQYQTLDCNLGSQEEISKHLLHQYGRLRGRELELGNTLTGPHRDDLEITLNGSEARYFASEGQQRTCVAALRCAEWQRIHLQIGEKPLMLIDDAGMGLDQDRQGRLVGHLSSLGQVFVTTTSEAFAEGVADRHCIRL
jgi:DNA replication and repair protein RecF